MTVEDSCQLVGIHRTTVWEWRAQGQDDPKSRYGEFEAAISKALMTAKAFLIHGVATHSDNKGKLFLLKNRYPSEFRDHIVQEVSGPDGGPIAVNLNPFKVEVILQVLKRLNLKQLTTETMPKSKDTQRQVIAIQTQPRRRGRRSILSHEELALLFGGIEVGRTRRKNWYRKELELER